MKPFLLFLEQEESHDSDFEKLRSHLDSMGIRHSIGNHKRSNSISVSAGTMTGPLVKELGNLIVISIFFDSPALRGNSCTSSTNGSRASNFFMELT